MSIVSCFSFIGCLIDSRSVDDCSTNYGCCSNISIVILSKEIVEDYETSMIMAIFHKFKECSAKNKKSE